MATLLYRLGKTAYRRWPIFLAAWFVLFASVATVAGTMSKPLSDDFSVPGIASQEAADLQTELFPESKNAFDEASVNLVVAAPEGHTLSEPTYSKAVDALIADLNKAPQMPSDPERPLLNPVAAAPAQEKQILDMAKEQGTATDVAQANADALSPLSEDGRIGTITWQFDVKTVMDVKPETREKIVEIMDEHRADGLQIEANGAGMTNQEPPGGTSELIGIGFALVVLLLTFGAAVSAGIPIVTAMWGVGLGLTGVTAMTAFTNVSSSTTILASMVGLAVGIDYALFILARYRAELEHTDDRQEAAGIAVGTAGSAVVFAGLTVLIALSALAVVRMPFLTAMGFAAAATVLIAVLVALTLLPALLGMLKSKAFGGQFRKYRPKREQDGRIVNNGVRWARLVGRAPLVVVLLAVVALGALAVPMKDLHLAFPTDSTASPDTTARKASDLMTAGFGPGREGPMLAVVDAREVSEANRGTAIGEYVAWVGSHDGVANAQVGGMNTDGTGALVMITPETGPDEVATEDLLAELRDGQDGIESETGTTTGVTGLTPITVDVSERLADALPLYLAVVIGLAFLLLMLVFRSILVPLTATLGFLLSVLATLGATVAVFQEGAFGIMDGQPIVSFMPIILIGLVFGLAMDYQVFLVTRMREAHVHGMSTRDAVIDGFRNSARVVSAAAVIMISVFAAFMLTDDPVGKSMGFALAIAVFFDAFVVRMALIPALMYLMGEKAWWLPKWLDRILPNVDVEGENLHRPHLQQQKASESDDDEDPRLIKV
jgi:RND superfamily putative drug exporter